MRSNSRREKMFNFLLQNQTDFLQHYEQLMVKYSSVDDIVREFRTKTKERVHEQVRKNRTKFSTYLQMNPTLSPSPFLDVIHPVAGDIIKFRVGSHYLPIETGRWARLDRDDRLCGTCGVVGDECHTVFDCSLIERSDLVLGGNLDKIWNQPDIIKLFKRLKEIKLI